jgi:hypothetical protein
MRFTSRKAGSCAGSTRVRARGVCTHAEVPRNLKLLDRQPETVCFLQTVSVCVLEVEDRTARRWRSGLGVYGRPARHELAPLASSRCEGGPYDEHAAH